jgi:hypothetical protein
VKVGVLSALVACAAIALAPAAGAKDLTEALACGESGCAALERGDNGDGLIQLRGPSGPLTQPPALAAYYTLNFAFGRRSQNGPSAHFTTLYVPSSNLVAANGRYPGEVEWFSISGAVLEKVRNAVRELQPFAAPKRWPATIAAPSRLPTASPAGANGRDSTPWFFALAAALGLGFGGLLAGKRVSLRLSQET